MALFGFKKLLIYLIKDPTKLVGQYSQGKNINIGRYFSQFLFSYTSRKLMTDVTQGEKL